MVLGKVSYIENFLEQPLEKRIACSRKMLSLYPERIPLIVGTYDLSLGTIKKNKYLVPRDLKIGMFVYELRKNIQDLNKEQSIFLFIGSILPPSAETIGKMYERYRSEDGFLYLNYSGENTFGCFLNSAYLI